MSTDASGAAGRKAKIDALLLSLSGVKEKKIGGLDGYFVNDRLFACIHQGSVGLRLPAAVVSELQFSRDDVTPFQPGGMAATREWVQIEREDAADYEKDMQLFRDALEYVRSMRGR